MLVPVAPTNWRRLAIGTPSKVTRSLYQGVMVLKDSSPIASSMGKSNSATPSLSAFAMRPEIFRITFPLGLGSVAARDGLTAPRPRTAPSARAFKHLTNDRRVG